MPSKTSFDPTDEQRAILDAFDTEETVVITAGAGTGKTSTLRLIAESEPGLRVLYLAFNKAIAEDAKRSFPRNVEARTAHSIAYRTHGRHLAHKFDYPKYARRSPTLRFGDAALRSYAEMLRREFGIDLDDVATEAVEVFMKTADAEVGPEHVDVPEDQDGLQVGKYQESVSVLARHIWGDYIDPEGDYRISHDTYLKLWQLDDPELPFDVVMLDEAQDADPVIAAMVSGQEKYGAQLVYVGDSSQAIYGWRGAVDFLSSVEAKHRLPLTQSFRFQQPVADVANDYLEKLDAPIRLTGHASHESSVLTLPGRVDAVLCRTNAGAIDELINFQEDGFAVGIVGGGQEIFKFAEAARDLQSGRGTRHPELAYFPSWGAAQQAAAGDPRTSFAGAVRLVDKVGPHVIMSAITAAVPEDIADCVVSTAHKAKGREWPLVRICYDFKPPEEITDEEERRSEMMLTYVAVTRAQSVLDPGPLNLGDSLPEYEYPAESEAAAASARSAAREYAAANAREYLDVPYRDKDDAKSAGAKWDADARRWYAPKPGMKSLERWVSA